MLGKRGFRGTILCRIKVIPSHHLSPLQNQNILNGLHHVIENLVGNQIFASHQNVDPTAALWQPEIGRTQWLPGLGPLN